MASNTTNFELVKPAYSEAADVSVINGNMDKVDASLNALGAGVAIIAKGDTHAAIASGQYVYVHNHGTLDEGMYKATADISQDAALSSSNLAATTGLNDLRDGMYGLSKDKMIPIISNSDLDNFMTPGNYFCASSTIAATLAHSPVSGSGFSLHVESVAGASGQYYIQTIRRTRTSSPGALEYTRCWLGTSWYDWGSLQESYDALPKFKTFTADANVATEFYIDNSSRIRADIITANESRMGTALIAASSTGTMYVRADVAQNITITKVSANKISITLSGSAAGCNFTIYQGDINLATS